MGSFNQLLTADEEDLLRILYRFRLFKARPDQSKTDYIANRLKLNVPQLLCALGFNANIIHLNEVYPILGYEKYDDLLKYRDLHYINDVYQKINLKNLLDIYKRIKYENEILLTIPQLIKNRLEKIEQKIEITVSSKIIDRYKVEIRTIYFDKIIDIDFVEERLNIQESGYRALLNEVTIIAESEIIPADDIFVRDNILLEEKRKMLQRGLVSDKTVRLRLNDSSVSYEEQDLLEEHLKQK